MQKISKALTYTVLFVWLAAVVLPIVWVFSNSIRSSQEIYENSFGLPWLITGSPYADRPDVPTPVEAAVGNFQNAWTKSNFSTFFMNSVLVTTVSLAGILSFGAMAAYALARFDFRFNRPLYLFFISGMMVPAQLVLIPLFFQFSTISDGLTALTRPLGYEVQLHNSLTGLITIYIALSLPFTILLLTGFFKSLPSALRESAIIDGASEWTVFRQIMLPLARPGLVTAAIFNFLGIWNEYLFALVFVNSPEKKTLPLGLASVSIQAQYKTDFGLMFAGLVIIMVPTLLVYLLLQRQLTKGITVGALKG
ncbi:MAG: carbohydrate ABC transporter permease [Candidatus Hydrogenedentes bacterium]|nr:carbohydrate ABC transporter permease [Candidatus Hydrogenedentota bacterium]